MRRILKEARHFLSKPKGIFLLILILAALAGLIASAYFIITYKSTCFDETCFISSLTNCKPSIYLSNKQDTVVQYTIKGISGNNCMTNVKILQVKEGSQQVSSIVGKDMDCAVSLGVYIMPDENIQNCHGLLKEEIQEMIIQRMYSQIVQNIDQVSKEVTGSVLGL